MIEAAKTVLIVEDDRDVREIAVAVLESEGCRVLEAASGEEAVRLLTAHADVRIDVLFTDVVMPGRIDGIALAGAARRLRPGLLVLYATGFANLAQQQHGGRPRGPILRKPYRPGELRRAIVALFDGVS